MEDERRIGGYCGFKMCRAAQDITLSIQDVESGSILSCARQDSAPNAHKFPPAPAGLAELSAIH